MEFGSLLKTIENKIFNKLFRVKIYYNHKKTKN